MKSFDLNCEDAKHKDDFFFFINELHGGALPKSRLSLAFLQAIWTRSSRTELKVVIDCPQPGSSRVTYRPPPISRWSKCSGNDTVMVVLRSGMSKVPKETQPE